MACVKYVSRVFGPRLVAPVADKEEVVVVSKRFAGVSVIVTISGGGGAAANCSYCRLAC